MSNITFDEVPDQQTYPEVAEMDAGVTIMDAVLGEDKPESNSHFVRWDYQAATPAEVASITFSNFVYYPKDGKGKKSEKTGKDESWKWQALKELAKKLKIETKGAALTQEFLNQFKGRGIDVTKFKGVRTPKLDKETRQPVIGDDGVTPVTFVKYDFKYVKAANPKLDVEVV